MAVGGLGVFLTLKGAPAAVSAFPPQLRFHATTLFGAIAVVFATLAFAGWALNRRAPGGVSLSILCQVAQMPLLAIGGKSFAFLGGIYFGFLLEGGNVVPVGGWSASLKMSFAENADHYLGLNLAPALVILLLYFIRRREGQATG